MSNFGIFENAVRSLLLATNPSILDARLLLALLDLVLVSDMENYDYSSRLALAIHTAKTIVKAYVTDKESNNDD